MDTDGEKFSGTCGLPSTAERVRVARSLCQVGFICVHLWFKKSFAIPAARREGRGLSRRRDCGFQIRSAIWLRNFCRLGSRRCGRFGNLHYAALGGRYKISARDERVHGRWKSLAELTSALRGAGEWKI